jgi:hypothetical protein
VSHAVALKRKLASPCDNSAVQIGIVAHVNRTDMASDLQRKTAAEVIKVDDAEFDSILEGTRRCAENHIRVLELLHDLAAGNEWCVVLEDDAVPVPGFRTELAAALSSAPSPVVGLYLGMGNPSGQIQRDIRQALDRAGAWITADYFISSVAYAIRANLIPPMLAFIKQRDEELPLRISRWVQDQGTLTAYTHPSLCNHADTESVIYPGIPLQERRKLPRVAWEWGTRRSWNTEAVHLPPEAKWSQP